MRGKVAWRYRHVDAYAFLIYTRTVAVTVAAAVTGYFLIGGLLGGFVAALIAVVFAFRTHDDIRDVHDRDLRHKWRTAYYCSRRDITRIHRNRSRLIGYRDVTDERIDLNILRNPNSPTHLVRKIANKAAGNLELASQLGEAPLQRTSRGYQVPSGRKMVLLVAVEAARRCEVRGRVLTSLLSGLVECPNDREIRMLLDSLRAQRPDVFTPEITSKMVVNAALA